MKYVVYNTDERIAHITINRPEKRNALNAKLVEELIDAFSTAENDPNVKIVILDSSSNVFCAGADLEYLKSLQANSYQENLNDSRQLMLLFDKIYKLDKIVIAKLTGHAIAGGAGLATVCDFVFSVPEAKYGYTEVNIGFVPAIVSIFLLRKIGETKAKELLLTGKIISANEAQKCGIFNFIVEKENIDNEIQLFTRNLLYNTSADSLKLTKNLINTVQNLNLDQALDFAAQLNASARAGNDCKKGISAFLNKEKIIW